MMRHIAIAATALLLAGCDGKPAATRLQATPQGLFFSSWDGKLYRVVDDKLVPVKKAAGGPREPKTLPFSQIIPEASLSGFPIKADGSIRFEATAQKIKIRLQLDASGVKKPSVNDQAKFVSGLNDGSERLKSIFVSFYDPNGYMAAPDVILPLSDTHWTRITDAAGLATTYEYSTREAPDPDLALELATVGLGWSVIPNRQSTEAAANDVAAAVSAADPAADAATAAAADATAAAEVPIPSE